jgi:hypothetical protein
MRTGISTSPDHEICTRFLEKNSFSAMLAPVLLGRSPQNLMPTVINFPKYVLRGKGQNIFETFRTVRIDNFGRRFAKALPP